MIEDVVMLAGDESQLCKSACLLLLDHKKLFNTFSLNFKQPSSSS